MFSGFMSAALPPAVRGLELAATRFVQWRGTATSNIPARLRKKKKPPRHATKHDHLQNVHGSNLESARVTVDTKLLSLTPRHARDKEKSPDQQLLPTAWTVHRQLTASPNPTHDDQPRVYSLWGSQSLAIRLTAGNMFPVDLLRHCPCTS